MFLAERLEVQRGLSTAEVRAARERGDLRDDDLIRPAGTSDPWTRLADLPTLEEEPDAEPEPEPEPETISPLAGEFPPESIDDEPLTEEGFAPPSFDEAGNLGDVDTRFEPDLEDDEREEPEEILDALIVEEDDDEDMDDNVPSSAAAVHDRPGEQESVTILPVEDEAWEDEELYDPLEEDEEATGFTLAPEAPPSMEELDLTAMVDVAFQLILFFLVTATSVYFKTLEIPNPNPERPEVATQQRPTVEELEEDYILVNINPQGEFTIDHEPVPATFPALAERLRAAPGDRPDRDAPDGRLRDVAPLRRARLRRGQRDRPGNRHRPPRRPAERRRSAAGISHPGPGAFPLAAECGPLRGEEPRHPIRSKGMPSFSVCFSSRWILPHSALRAER